MRRSDGCFNNLNTSFGNDILIEIWRKTMEYKALEICEAEGNASENNDNHYDYFSPEWLNFEYGYFLEKDRVGCQS